MNVQVRSYIHIIVCILYVCVCMCIYIFIQITAWYGIDAILRLAISDKPQRAFHVSIYGVPSGESMAIRYSAKWTYHNAFNLSPIEHFPLQTQPQYTPWHVPSAHVQGRPWKQARTCGFNFDGCWRAAPLGAGFHSRPHRGVRARSHDLACVTLRC